MGRAITLGVVILGFAVTAGAAKSPEHREGKKLYQQGKYAAALAKLRVAAKKDPRRASIRYLMGLAYSRLGRPAEAEAAFLEAKRIDPAIRFTRRTKFEEKLGKARRRAAAARAARSRPAAPVPTAAPPVAATRPGPAPAPLARPVSRVPAPRPAAPGHLEAPLQSPRGEGGAPLWALILLGVCGGFLGISFLRELFRIRR